MGLIAMMIVWAVWPAIDMVLTGGNVTAGSNTTLVGLIRETDAGPFEIGFWNIASYLLFGGLIAGIIWATFKGKKNED